MGHDCRRFLIDKMARDYGVEVTASTAAPIILTPYTQPVFICPHGQRFWLEPTSEQIAQWARDGVK